MVTYSGFTHQKWWFSIVILVYQRVVSLAKAAQFCNGKSRWLMKFVSEFSKKSGAEFHTPHSPIMDSCSFDLICSFFRMRWTRKSFFDDGTPNTKKVRNDVLPLVISYCCWTWPSRNDVSFPIKKRWFKPWLCFASITGTYGKTLADLQWLIPG